MIECRNKRFEGIRVDGEINSIFRSADDIAVITEKKENLRKEFFNNGKNIGRMQHDS